MSTDPPTLGEALRRLDQVTLQLQQVAALVAAQTDRNDAKYATKESVALMLAPVVGDVEDLKKENGDQAGFRRQVTIALLGIGGTAVVSIVVALTGLLAGGIGGV